LKCRNTSKHSTACHARLRNNAQRLEIKQPTIDRQARLERIELGKSLNPEKINDAVVGQAKDCL
jgi:hypothetical protein